MPFELLFFDSKKFKDAFKHFSAEQLDFVLELILIELQQKNVADIREGSSKPLGRGLFELRMQRHPDLLVRVFWAYALDQRIVILDAYDKKRDSSKLTQQRHISRSRSWLDTFRDEEYRK